MYKMKRILKRAIACLLAVLMLAGEAPMQKVLAAEVESQTEQQENVTKETEQQTAVQQAETEQEQQDKTDVQLDTEQPEDANDVQLDTEQPEDANDVQLGTGQPEETTGIQVEVPLLNYVYVDKNRVEIGDTQNIVLSVGDDTTVIESAKLYVQNKDGEQYTLEASEIDGNAILFAENYQDENQTGVYTLYSYEITVDGIVYTQVLSETGVDVSYGVNCDVESTPDAQLVDEDTVESDMDVVSFDEDGNQTSEDSIASAIENQRQEQNEDGLTRSTYGSNGNIVVVLDPGHDGSHGGTSGNEVAESVINLKIAQYCKEELQKYSGVTVYMTRDSQTCPYGGSSVDAKSCNESRVAYAKSVGADIYVSLHNNSASSSEASGVEIYYPNTNYNPSVSRTGEELASQILRQLTALGLKNRGTKIRTCKDTVPEYQYPDGSQADYYAVIRNCKKEGIPAIIVEHAFVTNPSDVSNYLSTDEQLKKLGVADATGIAQYYNLKQGFQINEINFQDKNNSVEISAQCSDTKGVQYRYLYYDFATQCWGVISEWTTESKVEWQPKAGNYWVQVAAIDSNGNGTTKTVSYAATHNYTGYYLDLNGMCYIMRDKGIDVGVAYDSNASNVKFKWQAYNLDKQEWSLVADWTGSNWVTWKPEQGNFWLYVEAMTPDGETKNTVMCFASQKDYAHHTLNLNGMCYNIYEDRIDVGIAYDSDDSNVSFKWEAYNLDTQQWNLVADWTGSNWVSWYPDKGNYWMHVTAKTSDGVTKDYTICFNAARNYNHKYISINGICSVNDKAAINLGVSYNTNDTSPAFRWQIYDLSTSTWSTLTDWTGSNWVSWYPGSGNYWVYVEAKTSDGTVENYCIAYQVTARYEIMGNTNTSLAQMVAYYNTNNVYPEFYASSDAPSIEAFCQIYLEECQAEGLKAEVAFCQAMLETGFLRYGGDVQINQYNFAGLGATGNGAPGNSFGSVREGVRAQVQHLKAYASTAGLNNPCVDSRFQYVKRGTAPYVEWLGIQENPYGKGWATAKNYGYNIVNLYIAKLFRY